MKTFSILLFIFLLHITTSSTTRDAEVEALLRWKQSLLESHPSLDPDVLDTWTLNNSENLCNNWNGIRCNSDGVVSRIFLEDPGINGTLEQFNFTSFPNLISFDLSFNALSGSIPSDIGKLTELQYLSLEANRITGTIPYQISDLQKLSVLNLASNHLKTPDWSKFKSMPSLRDINLRDNELTGEFPDFILKSRNLTSLDLSSNNFNGFIPESFSTNLEQLEYLALSDNSFDGPLSSIFTKLPKLVNIQRLYLRNNSISGEIPSSVGQYKNLTQLDLSYNNLIGNIPSSLGNLTNLRDLNLSYNHLEGPIPQGGQFSSFDNSSYIGNFALCGSPLTKKCDN